MKKKTTYLCSLIIVIVLIATLLYAYRNSCEKDILIKIYYIGGVFSGLFAFGAFFVAVRANHIQNKTGNLQRFETTFFNMLNLQQQITNDLVYNENISGEDESAQKYQVIQGRELFRYFWDTLNLRSMSGKSEQKAVSGYKYTPFSYHDGLKSLIEDFGIA